MLVLSGRLNATLAFTSTKPPGDFDLIILRRGTP
jgi:hypothetical protein